MFRLLRQFSIALTLLGGYFVYAQTVQSIEYFFDVDPGYGNGIPLLVSNPSSVVQLSNSLPALGSGGNPLSPGFHILYYRALASATISSRVLANGAIQIDSLTAWGLPESRLVYVDSGSPTVSTVEAFEYFIDVDPGYGNGTVVSNAGSPLTFPLNQTVSFSSVSPGFHVLSVRPRLTGGTWGIAEQRLVFVDQVGTTSEVAEIEYFFDSDPGYGLATKLTGINPSTTVSITNAVSSTGLSVGFHSLYLRPRLTSGAYGMPEQRLVYLDQSGSLNTVDTIEYFFDIDPGYGNGTKVKDFAAATAILLTDTVSTTGLSLGFHQLYFRPRYTGGVWGIPEQRLVYVDAAGLVLNVAKLEYFFDTDPGYGLGSQIAISEGSTVLKKVLLDATQLTPGKHSLFVRPGDQVGGWGLPQEMAFHLFPPSRELDSVSLIAFYQETNGANWTAKTNWITTSINRWFGVTVSGGRVTALALPNNNVEGKIPRPVGFLSELTNLDLSENILNDTIPISFQDLSKLVTLQLHANELDELPDLSGIATLNTLSLDSNYFDFSDLEPVADVPNVTYQNQKPFLDTASTQIVKVGTTFLFQKTIKGSNNQYQWLRNGTAVPLGDYEDLSIAPFTSADTGKYVLKVTNPTVPNLEISTHPTALRISDFEEDSLALVSLYQATNGASWTTRSNWLSGKLNTWHGVTMVNNRATSLSLTSNNLVGALPADFSYADALTTINLSGNQLLDTLPASYVKLQALSSLDISNNRITSLPSLVTIPVLATLNVSSNRLQFGDLEKNIGVETFLYSPQDSVGVRMDTVVDTSTNFKYLQAATGANNSYQWVYNGNPLSGATQSELSIPNIQLSNEGQYRVQVTNAQLPNLTLYGSTLDLYISSLRRDSIALRTLYDKTGGANWSPAVNWTSAPITSWTSITLGSNRVTGLDLSNRNLRDTVPAKIRDITSLQTLNLSGNQLVALPNLSIMPDLTTLNLANNRIGFAEIGANLGIANFTYSPQRDFTDNVTLKIPVGSDQAMKVAVSGSGNRYRWFFSGNQLQGQTAAHYTLSNIQYATMGLYHAEVTNPAVPNLTISSGDFTVLATADLSGVLLDPLGDELEAARVILYEKGSGPYDSISSISAGAGGNYLFEDLVLSNYLVKAIPDNEDLFVTYYGNTIIWTEADIIELRQADASSYDVTIAGTLTEPTGEELVSGIVEFDVPEEGRILARRKVVRAGCSMRRYKGTGRGQQDEFDLEYYVETNDEGRFSFAGLPNGLYRLNIDYPGVQMDESSFVDIEITGEIVLELLAVVTENGIVVEQTNALGIKRPFLGEVKVFPNPTTEWATVEYQIKKPVLGASLEVWSSAGQLMQEMEVPTTKGTHSLDLDVSTLNSGLYFIVLESDGKEFIAQFRLLID